MSARKPSHDAFISYSRSDIKEVKQLISRLEKEHGLHIWQDKTDLAPGDPIPAGLSKGIAASRVFIVIVSRSSTKSGWVANEYNSALTSMLDHGLPERVIPVVLGDADIPRPLRDRVAVRASSLVRDETVRQIASGIRASSNAEVLTRSPKGNLATIVQSAQDSLIILGHTLKKFLSDCTTRQALELALHRHVRITLMLQNPNSRFAGAYEYERILKNAIEPSQEIAGSIASLESWVHTMGRDLASQLRVLLTNHMPSHRVILVDDRACLMDLYLYGSDVTNNPTIQFDSSGEDYEQVWFRSIRTSISKQIDAPDAIDLVRDGEFDRQWQKRHVATFDRWSMDKKRRYLLNWHFYREEAERFQSRFGGLLESYVTVYLDSFKKCKRILVVGCGAGKEISHLARKTKARLVGLDYSSVAIGLAANELKPVEDRVRLISDNLYDLHLDHECLYDGIVANAALVHLLDRADLKHVLTSFFNKLEPGGLCFVRLLYKRNIDREREDGRFGSSRWFTYFDARTLRSTAVSIGFSIDKQADERAGDIIDRDVKLIATQGFRHEEFKTVYWPTVLLRKPPRHGVRHAHTTEK